MSGIPVDVCKQAIVNNVRHPDADCAVVGELTQATKVDAMYERSIRKRVVMTVDAAVYDLRIHPGTADVLSDLIDNENVDLRRRELRHPGLYFGQEFLLLSHHRVAAL